MEVIRLNAGNDRNGNPRRVYLMIENGVIGGAFDEGYAGFHAVPNLQAQNLTAHCPTFATTPAEYRDILREFCHKV